MLHFIVRIEFCYKIYLKIKYLANVKITALYFSQLKH
jgi:hypothetical protein